MRIICITASAVPSSSANSIQAMKACHALAQLGHEVTLLVPKPSSPPSALAPGEAGGDELAGQPDLLAFYGLSRSFPVEWVPAGSRRAFTWRAVRRAGRLRADLLYTWVPQSAVFALVRRMPVILEMHDLPAGWFGPLWYRLFLRLPGRKRLLVITRALLSALDEAYGTHLPPANVVLAPNAVEAERFADLPAAREARLSLGLPEAPTVLCAGHLYAGRGADLFLELAGRLPGVRFIWAGGTPADVEQWRARASAQGLANVSFIGFVANELLPLHLAAADVLLMPYSRAIAISSGGGNSALVSSPMKMFEYLAAGRAIVASDLPVFREVLSEGNALLVPPEDVSAWSESLRTLLTDPARRSHLAARARADSLQYSWLARASRALDGFISA